MSVFPRRLHREACLQTVMKHRVAIAKATKNHVIVALSHEQLEAFMRFQQNDPTMKTDFSGGVKH